MGMDKKLWWWVILVAYLVFMIEGAVISGADFMTKPVELPQWLAGFLFAFMGVIALVGVYLYIRNLRRYHRRMNYQEKFFRRGTMLILIGGAVGFLTKAIAQEAVISFATPIILVGYMMVIYPVVGSAVRQEREDEIIERLKKESEANGSSS